MMIVFKLATVIALAAVIWMVLCHILEERMQGGNIKATCITSLITMLLLALMFTPSAYMSKMNEPIITPDKNWKQVCESDRYPGYIVIADDTGETKTVSYRDYRRYIVDKQYEKYSELQQEIEKIKEKMR